VNRESLREHFEWFADWARGTSPLYATLARDIATDPALLELADRVPVDRAPANVFFAAVHSLLLDDVDHPLGAYDPTCVADENDARAPDDEAFGALQAFCDEYREELVEMLPTRRTQTNAVRRCTALVPAFGFVSRQVDRRPIALIEVGPSAGLNLCWDRYGYEYERADEADDSDAEDGPVVYGDASASVRLRSTLRGDGAPPLPDPPTSLPPVASRVGLDLNPLDVCNPDDVAWLLGLVWPEHTERHELLRAAIDAARENPPELRAGDALESLSTAVGEVPTETPVVVFDTQVRYQFDEAMDERYRALIRDLGADRELHWLSGNEAVEDVDGGLWLEHATVEREGDADGDPELVSRRLAAYQQHGRWIEWVGDERSRVQ
jgi:hypothetical protein